MSETTTPRRLRTAIVGNGIFSTIAGAATALFASQLADFMEIPTWVIYLVGPGTLAFGISLLVAARAKQINRQGVALTIVADVTWVLTAVVIIVIPGTMSGGGKVVYGLVSLIVAVFATLQIRGLIEDTENLPYRVEVHTHLEGPADKAWEMLSDLDRFKNWNPFIIEAGGIVEPGEQLNVSIQLPGRKPQTFRPTVTSVADGRGFEWLGSLLTPGLFDGRHRFELIPSDEGTTLVHSEEFSGVLTPLLTSILGPTEAGFRAMNEALAREVGQKDGVNGSQGRSRTS